MEALTARASVPAAIVALLAAAAAGGAAPRAIASCDARAYGARPDGRTLATRAIQRAIDECGRRGGVAILRGGTFLSGTLQLRDGVTLRIAPGATLLASPRIGDFVPHPADDVARIALPGSTQSKGNGPYHLIDAEGVHDVAVDGGGTIAGNGPSYWDRAPDGTYVARRPRPSPLLEFVASRGVRVENLTIRDAPGWTVHPLESSNVRLARLTIRNDGRGPNTDAIDIDSSRDVEVTDADIIAGDDCVVLKTTGRRGGAVPATEHVRVARLRCSSDDQGIKIGTESLGDFRDIVFSHVLIYRAKELYRPPTAGISMSMVDGARFENVIVSNVVIRDAATPLFLRLGNRGRGQPIPTPGRLRNVVISNVQASGGTLASSITGLPHHAVEEVTLSDVAITMAGGGRRSTAAVPEAEADYPHAPMFGPLPAFGLYVRHARGLRLRRVRIRAERPDGRPALWLDDVDGLSLDAASARLVNTPLRHARTIG